MIDASCVGWCTQAATFDLSTIKNFGHTLSLERAIARAGIA
jgi:hypothetical protein